MKRTALRPVVVAAGGALVALSGVGLMLGLSILLNLAYFAAGVVGVVLVVKGRGAELFLTACGTAVLALWLLGVVKAGGWIPLGLAEDRLNLALGVCLLALGRMTRSPEPAGA